VKVSYLGVAEEDWRDKKSWLGLVMIFREWAFELYRLQYTAGWCRPLETIIPIQLHTSNTWLLLKLRVLIVLKDAFSFKLSIYKTTIIMKKMPALQ
jgi:hypothetical protein